jgi:hypothetical protein
MKTYDCSWCSTETNREEKGSHVLKDGEMLCSRCACDPVIQAYMMEPEDIPRPNPAYVVIDIQTFEDVLDALRKKYGGSGIAVMGNHKMIRIFLNMSEYMNL